MTQRIPLVPTPKSVEYGGGAVDVTTLETAVRRVADLPSGAYRLHVEEDGIRIVASDDEGERNARATLRQIERAGPRVPSLRIDDEPTFRVRGFMLDVSRDKVPTMASLRAMVEVLASLKYNHLQLYTEHTFAYRGHEEVWKNASPMTPDEVRELDAYCAAHGIDLCPNQNCFGHMRSWLEHEKYAHLAETTGDWMFMDMPRSGPFSLCPTDPASLELIEDLLGQLLPCFRSGLVNIGCDETFDVGAGRSKEAVAERGKSAVYFDYVRAVAQIAARHGKRPMLWADMALKDPESLGLFPDDAIAVAWWYEPDAPFDEWCDHLRSRSIETWVCPGTSSWRSITGRTQERVANIANAARQGASHGATGFLLTEWGDVGHHQHWPITLNAMAQGAQAAWDAPAADAVDPVGVSMHVLDDPTGQLAPWLDAFGDVDAHIRRGCKVHNSSALFIDLYQPAHAPGLDVPADDFALVEEKLAELGDPPGVDAGSLMFRELQNARALALLAARWGQRRGRDVTDEDRASIAGALEEVQDRLRTLWLERNRPGGLDESMSKLTRAIDIVRGDVDGSAVR